MIEKLLSTLSQAFPPLVLPQKRYMLIIIAVLYLGAKQLVAHTENKWDDQLLEDIHKIALSAVVGDNLFDKK